VLITNSSHILLLILQVIHELVMIYTSLVVGK